MKTHLYNTAHPLAESGKPIFIPFGEWKYDGTTRQRLDRAHGERIANELNARVSRGEPGIPVYVGHPDVPQLAAKYPDKGALGWVEKIELVNEGGRDGLALTVAWDRDPGRGFRWFSPYWLANGREGSTYVVDSIASIGLVNNPNIPEFRLANEAEDNNQKKGTTMDREKLIQKLGLPPEATDDQIWEAFDKMKADADAKAAADAKAEAAKTAETAAATDAEAARRETDDAKRALDNERKLRADDAVSAAVRERRIGEGARETWKARLLKEGAAGYAALANEKAPGAGDQTRGLANECGEKTDSEKRKALVNEIMAGEKVDYDTAWQRAVRRSPELFK